MFADATPTRQSGCASSSCGLARKSDRRRGLDGQGAGRVLGVG